MSVLNTITKGELNENNSNTTTWLVDNDYWHD